MLLPCLSPDDAGRGGSPRASPALLQLSSAGTGCMGCQTQLGMVAVLLAPVPSQQGTRSRREAGAGKKNLLITAVVPS